MLVHPLAAFDRYGIVVVTEPSRFLRELPEDVYERWVLEQGPPLPRGLPGAYPRLGEADDPTAEDDPRTSSTDVGASAPPGRGIGLVVLRTTVVYLVDPSRPSPRGQARGGADDALRPRRSSSSSSNSVQNAMVGPDNSLVGGLAAAAVLILLNVAVGRLAAKSATVRGLVKGHSRLLVNRGILVERNCADEGITREDLMQALREHGVATLEDVRLAVLEVDGTISVLRNEDVTGDTHRPHRRFRIPQDELTRPRIPMRERLARGAFRGPHPLPDEDAGLLRRQLAGEDLAWDANNPAQQLRDDISTDEITPGWTCFHHDAALGRFAYLGLTCAEGEGARAAGRRGRGAAADFAVSVAGRRRGKGSSREQAPYAERAAGIRLLVAESFERIYRQNAINLGMLLTTDFSVLERVRAWRGDSALVLHGRGGSDHERRDRGGRTAPVHARASRGPRGAARRSRRPPRR